MTTRTKRHRSGWLLGAVFAVLAALPVQAEVRLPTGEYTDTAEDLKVKVLGGYVTVARSWTDGRWHVNPAWADLRLTFDSLDGSVKGIERAGTIYERSTAGLFIYKVDQPFYIQSIAGGFRWYDTKGNWITYDSNGHLTSYGDRNNVRVTFTLDGNGNRTQILDHFAQSVLTFQYTGTQLTGITDRVGRQVRYQYTGNNLTQVTDVLGNTWLYTYDGNGQLTGRTDPNGHTTTIVYAQSTPAGTTSSGLKRATIQDSASATSVSSSGATPRDYKIARVFTVKDPENNTTTYLYDYDRVAQIYTVTTRYPGTRTVVGIYDNLGRLRQETTGTRTTDTMTRDGSRTERVADERGLVTKTDFDGNWNPIKVTYPDGTSISATYDSVYGNPLSKTDEVGTQTTYQYDTHGNLTQMTEAVGLPEQRVTTYSYDQYGQRLATTRKGAIAVEDATSLYTYDGYGNVATMTDALGNASVYTFDVMGNVLTQRDPRGNTWTRSYNVRGWLLAQTDPLAHARTYDYDKVGNRTKITDALANATTLSYDGNDRLTKVIDAQGGISQHQYDPEGRRTKSIDPNNVAVTYGYDSDGRPTTVTDGNGNVTTTVYGDNTNGLNGLVASVVYPTYTAQYKYDPRNRVTQITQILDATTRFVTSASYDGRGNRVSQVDALNRVTLNNYDALNRLIRSIDALGGVTQFTYDVRDNLTSITDANGNATRYAFDLANRQTSETRPLGEITRYTYDSNSNLNTRTNAKGEQRQFTYDAANRRTQEQQRAADASVQRTITFGYDARDLLSSYDDGTTSAAYGYSNKGQKTNETVNYGGFSKTIQYSYQANGKKASFTYPDNTSIQYTYDNNNQLKTIATPQGNIAYDSYRWSVPTQITMPGVSRLMSYDALLRPTQIKAQAIGGGTPANPQGPVLMDYRYVYNEVSDITQRTTQDGSYVYGYDPLDRLTSATPPASVQPTLPVEGYTYDPVHNRTSSAHQPGPWQYNADNQLVAFGQGAGQTSYQYDANGNTVRRTVGGQAQTLSYDVVERLIGIDVPAATYYYDPMGRRLKKTVGGTTTWFQYADEGLIAEHDVGGTTASIYGWQPDGTWGTEPQFKRDAATYRFYHNDHLGTSQKLSDVAGALAWSAKAEAFGKTSVDIEVVSNSLRFPGQYFDAEIGTHYNRYRDYDPTTGRYEQSDPLGLLGGLNTYSYVGADPIDTIDPFGLARRAGKDLGPGCGPGYGTGIPDNPLVIIHFGQCCVDHDNCYDDCKNSPTKAQCDQAFISCVQKQCNSVGHFCDWIADQYNWYATISSDSEAAFRDARKKCRPPGCPPTKR